MEEEKTEPEHKVTGPTNSGCLMTILKIVFFPITLTYLIWKNDKFITPVKIILTVFLWIIMIGMGASSSATKDTTNTLNSTPTQIQTPTSTPTPTIKTSPTPTSTPTPSPTPVPTDSNGFPMDAEAVTVANLDKAPSTYNGKKITFSCIVIGFAKDDSGNATAVNCSDPDDFGSVVQVDTSLFDMTKINTDDTVRFYGLGMGSSTGKNAYGGDVSETVIIAAGINDLTSGYKK